MKLLIVLALVAAAFADEVRVVPLPNEMEIPSLPLTAGISMGQVFVPKEFMDAVKISMPIMRDAPVADEGLEVRFADAPQQVVDSVIVADLRSAPVADEGLEVRFAEFSAPEPVRIADPSLPEVAAEAPLEGPQPVRLPEAPLPAYETAPAAEPVRVAMPQYRDYRVKHFADPMLR